MIVDQRGYVRRLFELGTVNVNNGYIDRRE